MSVKPIIVSVAAVAVLGICGWAAFRTGAGSIPSAETASTPRSPAQSAVAVPASTPTAEVTPSGPPTVRPDANANVASVAEAARTNKFPERLSPMIAPKSFDLAAFSANPQAYLDIVEPGRVFQTAAPGINVPVLRSKGTASYEIPVGGSCTLSVISAPHAPTTFVTLDLGTFPNSLTAITVQANAEGEASTVYTASGGVIADVQVMAGSPLASGQVKFHVFVNGQATLSAK